MKKIIVLAILVCAVSVFVFAEDFAVQTVTGRVERESGNKKVAVIAGDTIDGEAVIHTGVGASLVLRDKDGKSFTINAAKNGKVAELTKAAAGIRIGGNVTRTDTTTVGRTTTQVGTASARASDQAADDDIAAE